MQNVYRFIYSCRAGSLEGLFVATEAEVDNLYGKEVDFGEVLGKHSEVVLEIDPEMIERQYFNEENVQTIIRLFGSGTISGYNPLDYVSEEEGE